jgi:23S rRNA (pseudouridine1915-N3)-methyltransferase
MQINFICMGNKSPSWVQQGFEEYAKRLPPACNLRLLEIPLQKRPKNADLARLQQQEAVAMLALVANQDLVIALDERGNSWDSVQLSQQLQKWLLHGSPIALLVGGPEGLAAACKQRANSSWSLSPLTLPHQLVRIVVAEQIYRAWSLLQQHPYHRA